MMAVSLHACLPYQAMFRLYSQSTDIRKSFDSLAGIIHNEPKINSQGGDVFLFVNKKRDKVKLLHWSGSHCIIYYKILERGG